MQQVKTTTCELELISALVDGQLGGTDCASLFGALESNPQWVEKWDSYQRIGHALRSTQSLDERADMAFVRRVHEKISHESSSPVAALKHRLLSPSAPLPVAHKQEAANEGVFRWKAIAGLASLAAIGAVGWNAFVLSSADDSAELARIDSLSREQVVVSSPQGPVVRDVRLDEFLAAHRQLGSTSAVQMPSGFLRNAGFDAPQNGGR